MKTSQRESSRRKWINPNKIYKAQPPPNERYTTKPEVARWVVLGGGLSGIYRHDSIPRIPNAVGTRRPWPMLFMCKNEEDARKLYQLRNMVERIESQTVEKQREVLKKITQSTKANVSLLTDRRKAWPVAKGGNDEWCVFWTSWNDAAMCLDGARGVIFSAEESLEAAIDFMLDYTVPTEVAEESNPFEDPSFIEQMDNLLLDDDQPGPSPSAHIDSDIEIIDRIPAPSTKKGKDTKRSPTSSRKERAGSGGVPQSSSSKHEEKARTSGRANPEESVRTKTKRATTTAPPRREHSSKDESIFVDEPQASSSASTARDRGASFDAPGPDLSGSSSSSRPLSSPPPPPSLPSFIRDGHELGHPFLNVRDGAGQILGSVPAFYELERMNLATVPTLGVVIDTFLDHFGFSNRMVNRLYQARVNARTVDEFAERLRRFSILEVMWLWMFIELPPPRQGTHRVRYSDFVSSRPQH